MPNWWCGTVTNSVRPLRHEKQTLTVLHAVNPTWEQTGNNSKCPTVPSLNYRIRQSFPGFLSWNISEEIRNTHLFRGRASTTQQGRDWLDLNMTTLVLVCVPPSVLELNDNLRTLVDTCKLISIINKLIEKKMVVSWWYKYRRKRDWSLKVACGHAVCMLLDKNKNILQG